MANEATIERGDFFAGLMQDHALIETRLKALEHVALAPSTADSDAATLKAVAETLAFFATDGARHEADEELTLFLRLRSLPEFKQILGALEFQHRMNDTAARELAAFVENFTPGNGRELRRLALRFTDMQRCHAISEERALFPVAASRLSSAEVVEMGREMRERMSVAARSAKP